MAFTFVTYSNTYYEEVYGLLGLAIDDPIMPADIVESNTVTVFLVENVVNDTVDFDLASVDDQKIIYYAGLMILAGYLYKNYMPNAIPKYMSSNKTVFDRFKSVDFNAMGDRLIGEGLELLQTIDGGDTGTVKIIQNSTIGTDPITGEEA